MEIKKNEKDKCLCAWNQLLVEDWAPEGVGQTDKKQTFVWNQLGRREDKTFLFLPTGSLYVTFTSRVNVNALIFPLSLTPTFTTVLHRFSFNIFVTLGSWRFCYKMQNSEKLCLKWNDFQENLNTTFGVLRNDKEFSDVTLFCEDGSHTEAHKVVLIS